MPKGARVQPQPQGSCSVCHIAIWSGSTCMSCARQEREKQAAQREQQEAARR